MSDEFGFQWTRSEVHKLVTLIALLRSVDKLLQPDISLLREGGGGGGEGGVSCTYFGVGVCRQTLKLRHHFRPENPIFSTSFQTKFKKSKLHSMPVIMFLFALSV